MIEYVQKKAFWSQIRQNCLESSNAFIPIWYQIHKNSQNGAISSLLSGLEFVKIAKNRAQISLLSININCYS